MPRHAADRSSFHSQSLGTFDVVPPSADIVADGHQGRQQASPPPFPAGGHVVAQVYDIKVQTLL